jgi:hypothetical protein
MNATIDQAPIGIVSSAARWTRRNLYCPPFLILLCTGVFLRVVLMVLYFPAIMLWSDSPRFARIDSMSIFGDFWMPAGYAMLLRLLRGISHQLWLTIAIQHAMGLSVGLMIFLVMCRLGAKRWVACLPAAVAFLSGDHLYLEHVVMADYFLIFLTAAGLAVAMRGLIPELSIWWLSTASALLAAAALTRSVGIVLLPILALCTAIWVRRLGSRRAAAIAAAILPGLGVFGLYVGAFEIVHGQYLGLSDMRGWNLYSRVAPFADCQKFKPPEGTAAACEERPASQRPGPFGYVWDLNSIARLNFPIGPETGDKLGAFAQQAILHQPGDYVCAVLTDLARYVDPSITPRPYSGQPREIVSFGWRDTAVEESVVRAMSRGYRGTTVHLRGQQILGFYQNVIRVGGLSICLLLVLTVLGMFKARGPMRLGICLFGLTAFALYVVPVMAVSYDFRYGIPPETFLVVSGVLGAASLWPQLRTTNDVTSVISTTCDRTERQERVV